MDQASVAAVDHAGDAGQVPSLGQRGGDLRHGDFALADDDGVDGRVGQGAFRIERRVASAEDDGRPRRRPLRHPGRFQRRGIDGRVCGNAHQVRPLLRQQPRQLRQAVAQRRRIDQPHVEPAARTEAAMKASPSGGSMGAAKPRPE